MDTQLEDRRTGIKLESVSKQTDTSSDVRRVGTHSHLKGLGLSADGSCFGDDIRAGLIGQIEAREAMGIVMDLVRFKKMAGKAVLLTGPSGTGKTALSMALARELDKNLPFVPIVASEVYSTEVKKTEVLMEKIRKAICIRVKDVKDVYEGEVMELTVEETENPHNIGCKSLAAVVITLRTIKGTKVLRLAPQINDAMRKENVQVGDVIYIESSSGAVKRLGKSDRYSTEHDLELEIYVPVPKGEVHKKKEIVQEITLHDLDIANSKPQEGNDVMSLLGRYMKQRKTEITEKLRSEVNRAVDQYINDGLAELLPGVLFIDEIHMLDIECFTFLNRVLESTFSPIMIFATNRGVCTVRGTELIEPHGIPVDLLDRLIIIRALPYTIHEIIKIISIRASIEKLTLTNEALATLGKIGSETSLRFALQMLEPARVIATATSLNEMKEGFLIDKIHIEEADKLFMDSKTSARRLAEQNMSFVTA